MGTGIGGGSHGTRLLEHEDSLSQLATHCIALAPATGGVRDGREGWWWGIDRSGAFKWQPKLKREAPRQLSR